MGGMRFDSPAAPRTRPVVIGLVSSLLLVGCITGPSSIGDFEEQAGSSSGDTGGSTGSTGEHETTTLSGDADSSTGGDDSIDSATSGMAVECGSESLCTLPFECPLEGAESCGGVLSRINANGCPRLPCDGPEDCPTGSTCFAHYLWGHCGRHICQDNEETGECECGFGLDCNSNALCIPDEEVPDAPTGDAYCGQFEDETSCATGVLDPDLGSCRWYEGFTLADGDVCQAQVPIARCIYASGAPRLPWDITPCPSDETLHPMMRPEEGGIAVLFVDPNFVPFGGVTDDEQWRRCNEDPERCFCGCPA